MPTLDEIEAEAERRMREHHAVIRPFEPRKNAKPVPIHDCHIAFFSLEQCEQVARFVEMNETEPEGDQ